MMNTPLAKIGLTALVFGCLLLAIARSSEAREIKRKEARCIALSEAADRPQQRWDLSEIQPPLLNEWGHVAFLAQTADEENGTYTALFHYRPLVLRMLMRTGEEAPPATAEGAVVSELSHPVLNDQGQVAVRAVLSESDKETTSVWLAELGGNRLLARSGMPTDLVGLSGEIGDIARSIGASRGRVAFKSELRGGGGRDANPGIIWIAVPRGLTYAAVKLEEDPSIPGHFSHFTFEFAINEHGGLILSAVSKAGGPYYQGIWYWSDGKLSRVASELDHPPGFERHTTYSFLDDDPTINNAGQVLYVAQLRGADSGQAMFLQGNRKTRVIARGGGEAPGGGIFSSVFNPLANHTYVLNSDGTAAFWAQISLGESGMADGIWVRNRGGDLALVARTGLRMPGHPESMVTVIRTPAINSRGQIAFLAQTVRVDRGSALPDAEVPRVGVIRVPGGKQNSRAGIWVQQPKGECVCIVRAGDTLEVARGDPRTVQGVEMVTGSGNEDGRPSALNDRGQVAFLAMFADGSSGVFVSSRVAEE